MSVATNFVTTRRTITSVLAELKASAASGADSSSSATASISSSNSRPLTAVVIGAGCRGIVYANYALDHPAKFRIVGVCDPVKERRDAMADEHGVNQEYRFADWTDVVAAGKIADAVIIATPDRIHHKPTIAFANQGYHILCEKPMSIDPAECREMVSAVKRNNVVFCVCHLMRYTPVNQVVRELIAAGKIGKLVHIQHLEPVGYWHFAHSFVRGQWNNDQTSTCSFMSKCCHDFDVVSWWMGGATNPVTHVSAMGNLHYFHSRNKPEGAADRCLDCKYADTCTYSAKRQYLDPLVNHGYKSWPTMVLVPVEPDIENITAAMRTGPYGRCVYSHDNNVADQQVATLQFADGSCGSLSMVATTFELCQRQTRVFGSEGQIELKNGTEVVYTDFNKKQIVEIAGTDSEVNFGRLTGHDGADYYFMEAFIHAVSTGDRSLITTGPDDTLASHMIVFYAEQARQSGERVACGPMTPTWPPMTTGSSTSSSSSSSSFSSSSSSCASSNGTASKKHKMDESNGCSSSNNGACASSS